MTKMTNGSKSKHFSSPALRPARATADESSQQGRNLKSMSLDVKHQSMRVPMEEGELTGTPQKDVLDIGDIAELFGCSREKVKRMARSGELPAFKFGKSWYVRQHDLERFLADKVESNRHLRCIQEVSP